MKLDRILCCVLLAAFAAEGAELFVAKSGNDQNPGSAAAPFATIGKAALAAKPGDTVKIGPGVYREQITFKKSGKKGAPIVFAGTRGPKGEFLTIVEAPGITVSDWTPAPEIGPQVWKAPLPRRPDLVMMDGAMIALINPKTMELPRRKKLPPEINGPMFSSHWGPKCERLPGLDLLKLPADIQVTHRYFHARKELFWPVIANTLAGWKDKNLCLRFADDRNPRDHRFTASFGEGFILQDVSYLVFRDLHLRGSRRQFHLQGKSSCNLIEKCLLMHGGARVTIDRDVTSTIVRGNIMTAGFIRSDLFKLRGAEDMRGGLLYLIFKYIIGTSLSDDVGVTNNGRGTKILDNVILQGLIGMQSFGPDVEVAGNAVREMSSVGICTGPRMTGKVHDNLVMNCGIPLRIHRLRDVRAKREEYHYRNLFVQARNMGTQVFVHCASHLAADAVNFEMRGGKEPVYKQNPPNPVDAGRIHIYHNTFWGGVNISPQFGVGHLAKRFRMVMPFYVVNNIYKNGPLLEAASHELAGPNLLYSFVKPARPAQDPLVAELNRIVDVEHAAGIWNKNDLPGLPDLTLAPGSPALEAGVDISRSFTVNGKNYPAFPGFAPGYFKGKAPAAGALQEGESMARFIELHRRAESAAKMLAELKRSASGSRQAFQRK